MPGPDELEWKEYVDFTGGLWQKNDDRDCAPNGLLECTDCFPDPSGGLKAFAQFLPVSLPFPTAAAPANANIVFIWSTTAVAGGTSEGLFILTVEGTTSPFTVRMFSLTAPISEANLQGGSGAAWSQIYSNATVQTMNTSVRAETFQTAANGYKNYLNLPISLTAGSTHGIFRFDTSTANLVFAGSGQESGVWTHQGRLLTITNDGTGGILNRIIYTDPGSDAAPSTANFISPLAESGTPLVFLAPYAPSDLLAMKDQLSLASVQGSITSPTVRQLTFLHARNRTLPVRTDIGLVTVVMNEGAYAFDGATWKHISPQISGDGMGGTSWSAIDGVAGQDQADYSDLRGIDIGPIAIEGMVSGNLGAYEHFIFFNNGYVMDARTGAWFTQTSAPGARYWNSDYWNRRVYVSTNARFTADAASGRADVPIAFWSRMGESAWTSMDTYSFTLPLIYNPGQKTNVSEIEYHLNTFNATSTLEVELTYLDNDGVHQTISRGPYDLGSAGPQRLRVKVGGGPSDWWKVRTILRSNRSGEEAPSLERMFCGIQASTRYEAAS